MARIRRRSDLPFRARPRSLPQRRSGERRARQAVLRAGHQTVNRVATLYGVYYEAGEGTLETGYTIDHTTTVMLVDKEGFLKLVLPFEGTAEQMAADIEYFL